MFPDSVFHEHLPAFFTTAGLVAVAEIGDKTQLLSLLLSARFRRPLPILAAVLIATIVNHLLASLIGVWLQGLIEPRILRWVLAASFLVMAIWTLIPDKLDEDEQPRGRWGAFLTTLVVFFMAEIGDKTQLATTALAARYDSVLLVTAGSTLGMLIANAPVILLGHRIVSRLPLRLVRRIAAAAFALLALVTALAW